MTGAAFGNGKLVVVGTGAGAGFARTTYYDGIHFGHDDGGGGFGKLFTPADGLAWTEVHTLDRAETSNIDGPRVAVGRVLK